MMGKISEKEYQRLYQMAIEEVPLNPQEHFFGISFVGPPGVGKSTVAKDVGRKVKYLYIY